MSDDPANEPLASSDPVLQLTQSTARSVTAVSNGQPVIASAHLTPGRPELWESRHLARNVASSFSPLCSWRPSGLGGGKAMNGL
jgi:hypothetical protein